MGRSLILFRRELENQLAAHLGTTTVKAAVEQMVKNAVDYVAPLCLSIGTAITVRSREAGTALLAGLKQMASLAAPLLQSRVSKSW